MWVIMFKNKEEGSLKLLRFCSNVDIMNIGFCLVHDFSLSKKIHPYPAIVNLTVINKGLSGKKLLSSFNL